MRWAVALVALFSSIGLSAQNPPAGATLAGRVLVAGAATETPVARTVVIIDASDDQGERMTVADDDGRFRFDGLRAGRYLVRAQKVGWVPSYYGSPRPGRPPGVRVAVTAGALTQIQIPLTPGAVIAGRVIDQEGRPMFRQFPLLLESRMVGDRRMISRTRFPYSVGSFERATNDLGEFRLYGLPPGTYYLALSPSVPSNTRLTTDAEVRWVMQPPGSERQAPPPPGTVAGYARLYYPGTPDPHSAMAITVGPGQVREGLEFRVDYAPVGRIEGVVQRPDGAPASGARVTLDAREPRVNLEGSSRLATTDPQGRFVFNSVPPDDYRVSATAASAANESRDLWAQSDVTAVGTDITGIALTLAPAATITGRLLFDGSTLSPPADLTTVRITVMGVRAMAQTLAGGSAFTSQVHTTAAADGTFTITGLPPDRYLFEPSWPGMRSDTRGWWLTGVRVGAIDVAEGILAVASHAPISDVTLEFRDRIGTIEGTLLDADGHPAPGYFVLAFPTDRAHWTTISKRMRPAARPATDGRFSISGLPGGEYFLAVVTEVDSEEATDARFLETLVPHALTVVVGEGATVRQDVRIGSSQDAHQITAVRVPDRRPQPSAPATTLTPPRQR